MIRKETTMHDDELGSTPIFKLPASAYEDLLVHADKRRCRTRDKLIRSQFPRP